MQGVPRHRSVRPDTPLVTRAKMCDGGSSSPSRNDRTITGG